jgi:2-hydroxychromene-2-carboxylate isomerase
VDDKNIMDADTLIALANIAGHDGAALFEGIGNRCVQNEYEQFTSDAIAASMFGMPWYVVDGESFWGQDRLDFVERAFQKKDATDLAKMSGVDA